MNRSLVVGLALLTITACNFDKDSAEVADVEINGDVITVSEESPILKKLEFQKLEVKSYTYHLDIPGAVKAIPNNLAWVVAPFEGRVTKSFIQLGQQVKQGAPLFEMTSADFFEATKEFLQAKDEMLFAEKNYLRQKDLLERGVGSQRDFEEAEVEYLLHKKEFEHAHAALEVFQVDTTGLHPGKPLRVPAPISGVVVENSIVVGQYLSDDDDPIATIAQLNKVWVSAQVREKNLSVIAGNKEVDVTLMAYTDEVISGKVFHVSPLVNEETRSVEVIIECDNSQGLIKPGMFATAKFSQTIENSIIIPAKAVLQMDNKSFVFVCTGKNEFTKQVISILAEDKECVVVKDGLEVGDEIVVNGSFYLLG